MAKKACFSGDVPGSAVVSEKPISWVCIRLRIGHMGVVTTAYGTGKGGIV